MTLEVGSKAVYPGQGPCLVSRVVKKTVGDTVSMFYQLVILDDSCVELFVPVDKAQEIGIRSLLKRSEIPKLLDRLRNGAAAMTEPSKRGVSESRQRAIHHARLLSSGSAFDLAEIIESLTELSQTKSLTPKESQVLERAIRLLVFEISEVMGGTRSEIEQQVQEAMRRR